MTAIPKPTNSLPRVLEKVRHAKAMLDAMPASGVANLPDTRHAIGAEVLVSLVIAYNLLGETAGLEAMSLAISSDTSRKQPPVLLNGVDKRIAAGNLTPDCMAMANQDRSIKEYFEAITGLLLDPYFYQRTRDGEKPLHDAALWGQRKAAFLILDLIEHFMHIPDRIKGSLSY
ncbi:hypothetical protein CcrC1_gp314 [Caulobacter phage C1]|nr:hypothetical protein CcrC1_gp314 [Caulobacter phage C1]UTU08543.1 hypothetical protein CcrC2_gp315 [Caulobacter phage C2]UTU09059.1 hypothetical protein CcrJ4_gp310 [Caulobacter phage J4]UTU09618.1 hypothetical protein CcrBL47_gp332 [Caulobacter phage BL47]UTU10176.1 hypothetical protein CcrRB23_gp314 [Caulobacter phage RB23]WGN97210.1 hypothetical protein [Bertelyvirus sp.]